jgi:3-oxoacyl-[acyl-carrier-protein] synthase II
LNALADSQRIVITGLGASSGYGQGLTFLLNGLRSEATSLRFLEELDQALPCRIGAVVPETWQQQSFPEGMQTKSAYLAWSTAREAWQHAALNKMPRANEGLKIHAALGWGAYDLAEWESILKLGKKPKSFFWERTQCGYGEEVLARHFQPSLGISSHLEACAASTQAIARAYFDLKQGRCTLCLAGGADSRLHEAGIIGYSKLGVLALGYEDRPAQACRPFDADRKGFVMGEGAGFVVMETLAHARERGVRPLAEICAVATTTDAFRLTDPDPKGVLAGRCIVECLERAGLRAADLDYIQAHGTGTLANDRAEVQALVMALGEEAGNIPISSLKPFLGHLSMAAGALETVASVLMLEHAFLAPCLNLDKIETGMELAYVRSGKVSGPIKTLLKNSFGFGGQNACLILSRITA